jgi:predicted MFS family arabinose efflux permease
MFSRQLKVGYFTLEGLNSFATVFYFYYLYFFMQKVYGFDNKSNLMLAALNGATYALTAWFAGRFAQRYGYFTALKTGFTIMVAALCMGLLSHSAPGHIRSMVLNVIGMSFTWPTLEALVSEGEPRLGLQHMLGIYNVVWAATASIASFSGGAMLEKFGLPSLFYVPIAVHLTQLGLTFFLESRVRSRQSFSQFNQNTRSADPEPVSHPGVPRAKRFLQMAWLANPFAYIAINTLIAVVPGVARRLELSTMAAGFCCSTWCFARLGAFALLWQWTQWHYRFRWLLLSYVGLVGSFAGVVLAPSVAALVLSQLVFGISVGLIYYSSLFYSMDRSDTKGEHGGIHEAAIGLGNCAGPAVGAAALQLLPQHSHSGILAVIALMVCGLGGLVTIWKSK